MMYTSEEPVIYDIGYKTPRKACRDHSRSDSLAPLLKNPGYASG